MNYKETKLVSLAFFLAVGMVGGCGISGQSKTPEPKYLFERNPNEDASAATISKDEAIKLVQAKYPTFKDFSLDTTKQNVIVAEQYPTGWNLLFFGNFSEDARFKKESFFQHLAAQCFRVASKKQVTLSGEYISRAIDSYAPNFDNLLPENCKAAPYKNIKGKIICLPGISEECVLGLEGIDKKYYDFKDVTTEQSVVISKKKSGEEITVNGIYFANKMKKNSNDVEGTLRRADIFTIKK
jgi:hypothetical protein